MPNVGMTFLRYMLYWQLVNSRSTIERGPNWLLSYHSTSCAVLSVLGKVAPIPVTNVGLQCFFIEIYHTVRGGYMRRSFHPPHA